MSIWLRNVGIIAGLCLVASGCAHAPKVALKPDIDPFLGGEIAQLMVQHHNHQPALPLLQRALQSDPNNAKLHRSIGIILRDKGMYAQSLAALERSLDLDPESSATASAIGVLYDLRRQPEAAEIWHRYAVDLDSKEANNYNNLGYSLLVADNLFAAIACFKEAIRLSPGLTRAYNNLGFAYVQLGNTDAALQSFSQGGPDGIALTNMGMALEMAGNAAGAQHYYQAASARDKRAKFARARLKDMGQEAAGSPPDLPAQPAVK